MQRSKALDSLVRLQLTVKKQNGKAIGSSVQQKVIYVFKGKSKIRYTYIFSLDLHQVLVKNLKLT